MVRRWSFRNRGSSPDVTKLSESGIHPDIQFCSQMLANEEAAHGQPMAGGFRFQSTEQRSFIRWGNRILNSLADLAEV